MKTLIRSINGRGDECLGYDKIVVASIEAFDELSHPTHPRITTRVACITSYKGGPLKANTEIAEDINADLRNGWLVVEKEPPHA